MTHMQILKQCVLGHVTQNPTSAFIGRVSSPSLGVMTPGCPEC